MESQSKQSRLVVAGGFMLLFSVMGIICNCFSLTIVPITTYFGFSRSSYALSQTLMLSFSSLFPLVSSWIYKKFDIIKTVRFAVVTASAAFFLQSYSTNVWTFYISYAVMGFCMGMSTSLPVSLLINEWTDSNVSTLIGICMMGSGIGGAIFNPVLNSLIASGGWQYAYRVVAVILAAISIPPAFLLLKRNPAAVSKVRSIKEGAESSLKRPSVKFMQPRVVLIALTLLFANGISAVVNFAINPQLQDLGYSASFASLCSSIEMAVMAVGKLIVGRLLDKKGVRYTLRLSYAGTAISLVALAYFRSPLVLFVALINLGLFFGCPIGTVASVAATKEAVGEENLPVFIGKISTMIGLGSVFAPMLLGSVYDITGSYSPLLTALGIFMAVYLVFIGRIFDVPLRSER